ncbi:MAG: beta-ketoacyl synthase N-terminal-like domain-containing protein, partial [Steroidobacteraceae bacterium]
MTRSQIDAQFASKVHGTLVLSRLLERRTLDFCLLFSSLSATLGGLRLATYGAANAFEEGFACSRTAGGTRWIAVHWDTWAATQGEQHHKGTTIEELFMWPQEGAEAVRRVLGSSSACNVVNSTADLYGRLDQWVYRKQLSQKEAGKKLSYYARPTLSTSYVAASNETEKRVARVFQDVLGIEKVGLEDNYFELGGNSLISLQVIAELQREFGVQLSPILVFEAPSVSELTKRLLPLSVQSAPQPASAGRRKRRARGTVGHADVAIIGMAGRFPGAPDVPTLWNNVLNAVESISTFSDEELRRSGIEEALIRNPNYVKMRGIVEDIELFDAGLFGFSPREAELMDPQHRLMLETAWETLEHAGYDPHRYDGPIGVFAGALLSGYWKRLQRDPALRASADTFDAEIANFQDSLATRISYKLNLNGPSLSVGTYCSTSAVAIHLACQSLRFGESDMALAGGVSL